MAKAVKERPVQEKETTASRSIILKPVNKCVIEFTIRGTSPLIMHKWSEKAKAMMREKGGGRKTKERTARDPEGEATEATYHTDDGEVGIPGMAFKSALVSAAHKDLGIEKTLVRKALFLRTTDSDKVLPIDCGKKSTVQVREDPVRVGQGSADLRYRPQFDDWSCRIVLDVDGDLLKQDDIINLVNRAGFGVGICEWRPEKGGEFGRFEVDADRPVLWKEC